MKKIITLILMALFASMACACARDFNNTPVKNLDLARFLGTWYEIARYDHSFEKGMDNTRTEYTLKPDGTVKVENTGWKKGKFKRSVGKAFLPDPEKEPGRLRVSFFGPFYSDYRVLMLSEDYDFALIGSKSDDYLWILSRTPDIPSKELAEILLEVKRRGYDVKDLIWVHHDDVSDLNLDCLMRFE